jgi:predicted aminopeptidase
MVLLAAASACAGPGYYAQAISGHWRLMRAREQVADILADPATDPELARRLRSARDLLSYAERDLDLPADDSYSSYVETGRSAVVWNVVTTPEFSLEARKWCFPVAGCVPYRGYFNRAGAERFASHLRDRGLDVSVRPATAYSTLGWFSDPLLDTMLSDDELQLAATLFHELAHRRLYLKGDTAFNEAFATFVGREGVRAWLSSQDDRTRLGEWQRRLDASDAFTRLQARTRRQLSALYARSLPATQARQAKQAVFDHMSRQYRELVISELGGHDAFGAWFALQPNNADLALFHDYHAGVCAFAALFEEAGEDFHQFHRLAQVRAGWPTARRAEWLAKPACCTSPRSETVQKCDMSGFRD